MHDGGRLILDENRIKAGAVQQIAFDKGAKFDGLFLTG